MRAWLLALVLLAGTVLGKEPILLNLEDPIPDEEMVVTYFNFIGSLYTVMVPKQGYFIYGIFQGTNRIYEYHDDVCEKIVMVHGQDTYDLFIRVVEPNGRDRTRKFVFWEGAWVMQRAALTYTDPIVYIRYAGENPGNPNNVTHPDYDLLLGDDSEDSPLWSDESSDV